VYLTLPALLQPFHPSTHQISATITKQPKKQGTDWVPIIIVGNKSDLRPEQRQVTTEQGRALADKFKCGFTEASARYNENVAKGFELMIAEVEKNQNPSEPVGGNKCVVM